MDNGDPISGGKDSKLFNDPSKGLQRLLRLIAMAGVRGVVM